MESYAGAFKRLRLSASVVSLAFVIDPALAKEMLTYNGRNRRLRKTRIETYARMMVESRWKLNGETIVFSSDGTLMEGQHRLLACVESGAAFSSLVAFGIDPSAFDTINTGDKKTAGDMLGMRGEVNTNGLAAAANMLWRYERGIHHRGGNPYPTTLEIEAVIEDNPNLRQSVLAGALMRQLFPVSLAATYHYLFSQADATMADRFFSALETGVELLLDDPERQLRERMIRDRASKTHLGKVDIMALMIKAWNYRYTGTRTKLLRWNNDEPFPVIQGLG